MTNDTLFWKHRYAKLAEEYDALAKQSEKDKELVLVACELIEWFTDSWGALDFDIVKAFTDIMKKHGLAKEILYDPDKYEAPSDIDAGDTIVDWSQALEVAKQHLDKN